MKVLISLNLLGLHMKSCIGKRWYHQYTFYLKRIVANSNLQHLYRKTSNKNDAEAMCNLIKIKHIIEIEALVEELPVFGGKVTETQKERVCCRGPWSENSLCFPRERIQVFFTWPRFPCESPTAPPMAGLHVL